MDRYRTSERDWERNVALVQDIANAFEEMSISTIGASRIGAYRKAFEDLRGAAKAGSQLELLQAKELLQTMVDFDQLRRIIAAARASSEKEGWQRILPKMVSGTPYPDIPEKRSTGRDFQFEGFLAAVMELSGYTIRFAEPDLVVSAEDATVAIAAKRPRTSSTIERNFKRAVKQIQRSALPGLVAMDLSTALYSDRCINTNDLDGGAVFVEQAANDALSRARQVLIKAAAGSNVFAVLVHVQLPVLNLGHPVGPQIATAIRWTFGMFEGGGEPWKDWVEAFALRCEDGMFGELPEPDMPGQGRAANGV